MIINSVACVQKNSKKSVGKPAHGRERVRKENKCSRETEILHELVHDTTRNS